jgi:hypothetical protein
MMKRLYQIFVIIAAVVILAGAGTLALLLNANSGSEAMDRVRVIPPLDASAPTVTETAMFAVG